MNASKPVTMVDVANAVSRRAVLRIGFGLVLTMLVASVFAAYRVQETFSRRSVEIHRRLFQQHEILNNLSRLSWLAATTARDAFLSPERTQDEMYVRRVQDLRKESAQSLQQLAVSGAPVDTVSALRGEFERLWETVDKVTSHSITRDDAYVFLQQQVVPRRRAAGALVRKLEDASRASILDRENEFARTRRTAAHTLLILLGLNALVGMAVAIYTMRYSERLETLSERQLDEVSRAKRELERLSARLMEVQEEERSRLARELHDEIVQNLAVLKMEITRAMQPEANRGTGSQERLERARGITEQTMRTVRNIMLLLRPSLLDDLGLAPALQWLAEDFQRRTGVPCQFTDDAPDEELPDAVKTCVFRVVQEALHNAEKHASPSRMAIRIEHGEDWLRASVTDDGRGFKVAVSQWETTSGHFGLLGMRERASALRGTLTIDSAPGKGTAVTLKVPLAEVAEAATARYLERHA